MRLTNFLFTSAEISASVNERVFDKKYSTVSLTSSNFVSTVAEAQNTLYISALQGPNNRCPTWDELFFPSGVYINSENLSGSSITDVQNITGFTLLSNIAVGDIVTGSFTTFSNQSIIITINGTTSVPGFLALHKNSSHQETISIPTGSHSNQDFTFNQISANSSDLLRIYLINGT